MPDRKSRYRTTPVTSFDDGAGEQPLLELRETPTTTGVLRVTPSEGDRLDLLAWRFYREPTRFWRICDASSELDPFDVLAPGRPVVVPSDK